MWLRIYIYGFFQTLYFDQFLWFVYLLHLGYGVTQIGLGYAACQLTRMIFDVPSSWLADHFGKRAVLFAAAIAKALSSLCFLCGGCGFIVIVAGFIFAGFNFTLPSGVDLTYLQDVAGCTPDQKESAEILRVKLSRFVSMETAASLMAGIFGGVLCARSFHVLYVADLLAGGITMILVWTIPAPHNPGRYRQSHRRAAGFLWKSYSEAIHLLAHSSTGFRMSAGLFAVVWALSAVQTDYSQGLLRGDGLSTTIISLIFAAATLFALFSAWLTARIKTKNGQQMGIISAICLYAVSGALRAMSLASPAATVVMNTEGIAVGRLGSGLSEVLFNGRLLLQAPVSARATVLSAVNTMQLILQVFLFMLFAVLAAHAGLHSSFAACSIVLAAAAIFATVRANRHSEMP